MHERHEFLIHRIRRLEKRVDRRDAARNLGDSIALLKELCSLIRRIFEEDHPSFLYRLHQLAGAYRQSGDSAKAVATYRRVADLLRKKPGGEELRYAGALNTVGVLYCETEQPRRALRFFERGLAIARRCLANDDPGLANLLANLANAHHSLAHLRRAEVHYREALVILELYPQKAEELGHCLCDLAVLEGQRQNRQAALQLARRALESFQRAATLVPTQLIDNVVQVACVFSRVGEAPTALRLICGVMESFCSSGTSREQELVRWIRFFTESDGDDDLSWFGTSP